MYCPKCGKQCPDQSKYCSGCGASFEKGSGLPFELNRATIRMFAIAALLILSMVLWQKEIIVVDAYIISRGATGDEMLGVSGLLKLVINLAYIAAAGLMVYPIFTGADIEKKNYVPAAVVSCGMVGALAIAVYIGMVNLKNEISWVDGLGEVLEYVEFGVHSNGWLLILSCVIITVLVVRIHQEVEYIDRYGRTEESIVVHTMEGEVVSKKADLDYYSTVESVTIRTANGSEKVLKHDKMDGNNINVGDKCYVKYVGDKISEYVVK